MSAASSSSAQPAQDQSVCLKVSCAGKLFVFTLDLNAGALNAWAMSSAAETFFPAWPTSKVVQKAVVPTAWAGLFLSALGLADTLMTKYEESSNSITSETDKKFATPRLLFSAANNASTALVFTFLAVVAIYCDVVGNGKCDDVSNSTLMALFAGPICFALAQLVQGLGDLKSIQDCSEKCLPAPVKKAGSFLGKSLDAIQNSSILVPLAQFIEMLFKYDDPANWYKVLRYALCSGLGIGVTYLKEQQEEDSAYRIWAERLIACASAFTYGVQIFGLSQPLFWSVLAMSILVPPLTAVAYKGLPLEETETERELLLPSAHVNIDMSCVSGSNGEGTNSASAQNENTWGSYLYSFFTSCWPSGNASSNNASAASPIPSGP